MCGFLRACSWNINCYVEKVDCIAVCVIFQSIKNYTWTATTNAETLFLKDYSSVFVWITFSMQIGFRLLLLISLMFLHHQPSYGSRLLRNLYLKYWSYIIETAAWKTTFPSPHGWHLWHQFHIFLRSNFVLHRKFILSHFLLSLGNMKAPKLPHYSNID